MSEAAIDFHWVEPRAIELRMHGHITSDQVASARDGLGAFLGAERPLVAFFDTTAVSGFDPSLTSAARGLLEALREAGVMTSLAVAPNRLVRMMGSALALGGGLSMRFFGDRAEALAQLDSTLERVSRRQ